MVMDNPSCGKFVYIVTSKWRNSDKVSDIQVFATRLEAVDYIADHADDNLNIEFVVSKLSENDWKVSEETPDNGEYEYVVYVEWTDNRSPSDAGTLRFKTKTEAFNWIADGLDKGSNELKYTVKKEPARPKRKYKFELLVDSESNQTTDKIPDEFTVYAPSEMDAYNSMIEYCLTSHYTYFQATKVIIYV